MRKREKNQIINFKNENVGIIMDHIETDYRIMLLTIRKFRWNRQTPRNTQTTKTDLNRNRQYEYIYNRILNE